MRTNCDLAKPCNAPLLFKKLDEEVVAAEEQRLAD